MKKNIRGVLSAVLLASLLLLCLCVLPAAAEDTEVITGAPCGEGLTWKLDTATGELVISGEGEMTNYSVSPPTPWYNHRDRITSVRLEEGVTSIGSYAFFYCDKIVSVSLPDTLISVNSFAFWGCSSLESVTFPEGVSTIVAGAFQDCSSLTAVTLPASLTTLGNSAFGGAPLSRVQYNGTEEEWAAVNVGANNTELTQILTFHTDHAFDQFSVKEKYLASPATCTDAALYYKSCICGKADSETFSRGEPIGHSGGTASCTEQAVCEVCDEPWGDLLPHTPGDEPTCLAPQLCTVCEAVLADALGHEHVGEVTRESTCTEEGVRTYTCSRCDDSYEEALELAEHTEGEPATCLTPQLCTVCEAVLADALGHDHAGKVTREPTCTEEGVRAYTCSRCGDSYDETVDPKGHTEGAPATCEAPQLCSACGVTLAEAPEHDYASKVTREPTCTEAGVRTYTCSRCDSSYNEAIDPKGHTEGAPATCEAPQLCSACGVILASPLGHDFQTHTVEPTCVAQGYTAHVCSRCSHTYHDSFTAAKGHTPGAEATCTSPQFCTVCNGLLTEALGHEYTHVVTEPTCTAVGYTTHACTRCDHVYRDSYTDVKAHTPGSEATCTKPQLCEVCGKLLSDAPGHDYAAVTVPPTCTAKGYTTHTCSRCDDSYTDTPVDAVGHIAGDAPTCVTDQTCTACGQVMAQRLGHDYLTAVTLQPTCTEQGIMSHTCSRCKDSYTRSIAPNGHTPGPEATCAEAQLCTVCNTRLADKLGHNYGTRLMDPTCDERGYTLHECSRCGSAYMDTPVPAKGHTPGEAASCTEAQTCTVCATVLVNKLGHKYDKTVTAPTCLERGFTTRTCSRCNHTYLSDFQNALGHKAGAKATCTEAQTCTRCASLMEDKLGHSYTDTVVPPTCTEPGYTLHKCDLCRNAYTDTVVEATGHTAGDWITDRHPGFGEAGRHHLECTVCKVLLESETFVSEEDTAATEPVTDENGVTQAPAASESTTEPGEGSGCGQTAGNVLVIVLVLIAAFLFWYIDSRRRSR